MKRRLALPQVPPCNFASCVASCKVAGPDAWWDLFHFLRSQIPNKGSPNSLLPRHLLSLSRPGGFVSSQVTPNAHTTPLPSHSPFPPPAILLLMPQQLLPCLSPWPCSALSPHLHLSFPLHSRALERACLHFFTPSSLQCD